MSDQYDALTIAADSVKGCAESIGGKRKLPVFGEWYWVTEEKYKPWLGCVVHVGSNYVKVEGVGYEDRVHASEVSARCKLEPEPDAYIQKRVAKHQREITRLTHEIKELTAHLGLTQNALPNSTEATFGALAVRSSNDAVGEYKQALVLAQDKTLPALFQAVRKESEKLKSWLTASLIPLNAQADSLEPLIGTIKNRIFHVELYAGLVEQVEQIADGEPAPLGEPIHLMQRRAYMDEECLASYEVGGMDFDEIEKFDTWFARPENRDRVLPFPRCLVAFKVRRREKAREVINISDFIDIHFKKIADESTFLYIRNGERLYRLSTALDFGYKLFPDGDCAIMGGGLVYAKTFANRIDGLISAGRYEEIVKDEQEVNEFNAALERNKKPGENTWMQQKYHNDRSSDYEPFTPDSVYYDDIEKVVQKQIDEYNRLVIVLQGLLDRSPVFHPHAPISAWTEKGFKTFKLVYDASRALTPGDAPDFEAYRAKLNALLSDGCVTVGQDEFWERKEGEIESRRLDNDWRTKTYYRPETFRPHGNPGPGHLATVVKYSPRAKTCSFKWERERRSWSRYRSSDDPLPCSLVVPAAQLLNVSAYQPGDYKQFFNDPRTRADYLKWAPLLLRAEEWHAKKGSKK